MEPKQLETNPLNIYIKNTLWLALVFLVFPLIASLNHRDISSFLEINWSLGAEANYSVLFKYRIFNIILALANFLLPLLILKYYLNFNHKTLLILLILFAGSIVFFYSYDAILKAFNLKMFNLKFALLQEHGFIIILSLTSLIFTTLKKGILLVLLIKVTGLIHINLGKLTSYQFWEVIDYRPKIDSAFAKTITFILTPIKYLSYGYLVIIFCILLVAILRGKNLLKWNLKLKINKLAVFLSSIFIPIFSFYIFTNLSSALKNINRMETYEYNYKTLIVIQLFLVVITSAWLYKTIVYNYLKTKNVTEHILILFAFFPPIAWILIFFSSTFKDKKEPTNKQIQKKKIQTTSLILFFMVLAYEIFSISTQRNMRFMPFEYWFYPVLRVLTVFFFLWQSFKSKNGINFIYLYIVIYLLENIMYMQWTNDYRLQTKPFLIPILMFLHPYFFPSKDEEKSLIPINKDETVIDN